MKAPDLDKLSVCFIAGTLGQGGAERQLFYMIQSLYRVGARLRVLCLSRGEYFEEKIRDLGVQVDWVGQHPSRWRRFRSIVKELRTSPPDIVQSQHFYTNLYATSAARALGRCDIGAIRSDVRLAFHDLGNCMARLSLHIPRCLAVNSLAAIHAARAKGIPANKLFLLKNVVDTERFRPAGTRYTHPVRLISVGRLVAEKRHDRFLSLLASLRSRTDCRFEGAVIGSGPLETELRRRAAELGLLPGTVEFIDAVDDVAAQYRNADVLVLSSDSEGTPNVILEAMASGLPIVATRVGDVPALVEHGASGYLADPEQIDLLTDHLLRLVNDRETRLQFGSRGRQIVETQYSVNTLPDRLARLYEQALSRFTAKTPFSPGTSNSALEHRTGNI